VLDAAAPSQGWWQWEATAAQRTLVERDTAGQRLLKETGPLARLRITARPSWAPAGRIEFSAALARAQLDYEGRTQAGLPLATTSRHLELEAGAAWKPSNAYAWGEPAVTFDALWFRRSIAASADASSLQETSTLWMPGLAWTSPAWSAGGAKFALKASWRASLHHHLAVDYAGLFDPSSLRGGRRSDLSLAATAHGANGWSSSLEWRRARQAESDVSAIFRAGVPAGTVRQPHIAIDDIGLKIARDF
jgi:hypothetical protein